MKSCPHCNLYFSDGYACPQCGGPLYDQDAFAQQAAYPAAPGYEQQPYAQQSYGYAAPQQTYAPQPTQTAAYQPMPAQTYSAPEPTYVEPAPEPATPQVAAAPATAAPRAAKRKGGRGKTIAIVLLAILAVALGAACAFLALDRPAEEPKPTQLESAVVNSAWTWQTNVSDLLDEMDAAAATMENAPAGSQGANAPAAAPEAATAGEDAPADAVAAAGEAEAATDAAATSTADAMAAEEQPVAEDVATQTEAPTDEEAAALAEAEALVAAAEANQATGQTLTPEAAGANAGLEQMGESIGKLMGYMVSLATLVSDEQMQALDAPLQAMREEYPDLVSAWDAVRDIITTYAEENLSNQDDAAANDADPAKWEQFLESFRTASDDFLQKANEAGFALS